MELDPDQDRHGSGSHGTAAAPGQEAAADGQTASFGQPTLPQAEELIQSVVRLLAKRVAFELTCSDPQAG
jgi:hypothetical protein